MSTAKETLGERLARASLAVGGKLAADKTNRQDNYDYVSADAIIAHCGQALASAGVVIIPSIVGEEVTAVEYKKDGIRYDAVVTFDFSVLAPDAEAVHVPWVGRGSDYRVPDKATAKAITSGHRYFLAKLLNVGAGNEDGEHEAAEPAQVVRPPTLGDVDAKRKLFHKLGTDAYGDGWPAKRERLNAHFKVASSNDLTIAQADTLIEGFKKLIDEQAEAPPAEELVKMPPVAF